MLEQETPKEEAVESDYLTIQETHKQYSRWRVIPEGYTEDYVRMINSIGYHLGEVERIIQDLCEGKGLYNEKFCKETFNLNNQELRNCYFQTHILGHLNSAAITSSVLFGVAEKIVGRCETLKESPLYKFKENIDKVRFCFTDIWNFYDGHKATEKGIVYDRIYIARFYPSPQSPQLRKSIESFKKLKEEFYKVFDGIR